MRNFLAVLLATTFIGGSLFAATDNATTSKKQMAPQFTKADRDKLADVHKKYADCLKSDKPLNDCRQEMFQNCKSSMGDKCPMMAWERHRGMHAGTTYEQHGSSSGSSHNK